MLGLLTLWGRYPRLLTMRTDALRAFAALLAGVWILTTRSAAAQIVNVLEEAADTGQGITGKTNVGSQWLSGNTESLQFTGSGLVRHRSERHLTLLMLSATYGEQGDKAFIDQETGHARHRYDLALPLQLEAFVQGDRNPFRRRVLRVVFGAGPRLQLLHGPLVWSSVGLSYMPEHERFGGGAHPDAHQRRWRHRLSSYLSHVVNVGDWQASTTVYLQPALDELESLRAFADLSLEWKVRGNVSLAASYALQLDTRPPASVRQIDGNRQLSVSWTF